MVVADIKLRPATAEHLTVINRIAFSAKAYWGYSDEFMEACRDELTTTVQDLNSGNEVFQLAMSGEEVVGFCRLRNNSGNICELDAIFVDPYYIGRDVGKVLLDWAKGTGRSWGKTEVVMQSDPDAAGFYLSQGGSVTGERESESISGRFLPLISIPLD